MSKKEMISYKPKNTRKYQGIPGITQEYLRAKNTPKKLDRIFQHSYPTRTQPANRYFFQYPTRPEPILKTLPVGHC